MDYMSLTVQHYSNIFFINQINKQSKGKDMDFKFHTIENTDGERKEILTNVKNTFGFVPNLFAYMVESPAAIKAYIALDGLVSQGTLSPAQQQLALFTVSHYNNCDFCQGAHRAIGKGAGINNDTIQSILQNTKIQSEKDAALVKFLRTSMDKRGWVSDEDLNEFLDSGFTKEQVFELNLIQSMKTLSNYSNHLTKPELNPELAKML